VLLELRIRDLAIIDSLALPFTAGLNVLTGETGAGKSIIVGALSVLVGERATSDLIRTGAEKALVEGVFDVAERRDLRDAFDAHGIDVDEGTVVLKREIGASRTRAWANGTPVTTAVLAELGRALVNIHGQHEAQQLLDPSVQRRMLDAFGLAEDLARNVRDAAERYAQLVRERDARAASRADAKKREDWLRHVARELGDARLKPGEDAALADELRVLSHGKDLRETSAEAAARLDGDDDAILGRLADVHRALTSLQRIDPSVAKLQEAYDTSYYQLQELARELGAYSERVDADPARLAAVERRRDLVVRLIRKYGGSEDAALAQLADVKRELALLDDVADENGAATDAMVDSARGQLASLARELTTARSNAGRKLADAVQTILPHLGLSGGQFGIELRPLPAIGADGAEDVEFMVALNVGHPVRPLARIASGGELSRVMLAIKTILARLDRVPTLVFDEVDAGIGGAIGTQVGDAMRRVADHHQVFAITHLPQIAVRAQHHIVVAKNAAGGVTTAGTTVVDGEARIQELARMLGGDPDSAVSREHARELIAAVSAANAPRASRTREKKSGRR